VVEVVGHVVATVEHAAGNEAVGVVAETTAQEERRRLLDIHLVGGLLPSRSIAVTQGIESKRIVYTVTIPPP